MNRIRAIRQIPRRMAAVALLSVLLLAYGGLGHVATPATAVPAATVTLGATAQSDHFTVRAQRQAVADKTLNMAERAWADLAPHFARLPAKPIVIVVVEDSAEYERIQPAPMTRGFATFGGRQVYLLGDQLDQEVVGHELVHILLGYNVSPGLTIPDWFNEGLAQYASGAQRPSLELIYSASSGEFLPLPALDQVDALRGPHRELATIEGLAVVGFLADTYGEASLWDLVRRLSQATSFSQALTDTYGRTDLELNQEWMAYARENYNLLSPAGLRLLGGFAFALLAVIAATVWLARRAVLLGRTSGEGSLTQAEIAAASRFEREMSVQASRDDGDADEPEHVGPIDTSPPPP